MQILLACPAPAVFQIRLESARALLQRHLKRSRLRRFGCPYWDGSQGKSDRDYFQIAPETISERLKSKIFLGGNAPTPPYKARFARVSTP